MKVIVTHTNTDFDSLAAQLGAHKLYPDATPVLMQTVEANVHAFIRLHGGALGLTPVREIPLEQVSQVIVVDTQDTTRLERLAALADNPDVRWIVYDHHPVREHNLTLERAEIEAVGATTTLVVREIRARGLALTPFEATVLALGIYEDTGNLTFPCTTPADAAAVAFLLESGANLEIVNQFINRPLSGAQQDLLNELVQRVQIRETGQCTVLLAEARTDRYVEGLSLVTHKLLDLYNANLAVTAVAMGERTYIVSRSRVASLDARWLISPFQPKGQPGAACARVDRVPPAQVLQAARRYLDEEVDDATAEDIMTTQVRAIPSHTTIEQARRLLLRYDYEGLPVVKNGRLVGVVTRQDLDRAHQHWLTNVPVGHWLGQDPVGRHMSRGQIVEIGPDTPLGQIQRLMIVRDVALIPVTQDGEIVGIVTRRDVLREVYGREYGRRRLQPVGEPAAASRLNLREAISKFLPPRQVEFLMAAAAIARQLNYSLYLVGGGLRDILLGRPNYDIDLVVEGDGIAFARQLSRTLGCSRGVTTHEAYGTAKVHLDSGEDLDIATAREEFYEFPGADPQVEAATLRRDLYRRDFTVNALAVRVDLDRFGQLVDYFGGYEDLQHRLLRVLHQFSFTEDPTRLFRAVRFERKLDFRLEPESERLARQSMATGHFDNLLHGRIKAELKQILGEVSALPAIERLAELGGLRCLQSDLALTPAVRRKLGRAQRYFRLYQRFIGQPKHLWVIHLDLLMSEQPRERMASLAERLGFTNAERAVLAAGWRAEDELPGLSWERLAPSAVHARLEAFPPEVLLYALAVRPARPLRAAVRLYWTRLRDVRLHVSGHDLRRLGLPPGPRYGEILGRLLELKLDGKIQTEEEERQMARQLAEAGAGDAGRPAKR